MLQKTKHIHRRLLEECFQLTKTVLNPDFFFFLRSTFPFNQKDQAGSRSMTLQKLVTFRGKNKWEDPPPTVVHKGLILENWATWKETEWHLCLHKLYHKVLMLKLILYNWILQLYFNLKNGFKIIPINNLFNSHLYYSNTYRRLNSLPILNNLLITL